MTPTQAGAAVASHGIDLVNEHYARSVFLALLEQVSNTRSAHSYKHLDEIGTADAEEGHIGFARDCPRQQSFARPGRAHQQHTLGDFAAKFLESLRILQKLDDLLQLGLGLVGPRNVGKGGFLFLFRQQAGPAFAK